jgi:hypothetical protein
VRKTGRGGWGGDYSSTLKLKETAQQNTYAHRHTPRHTHAHAHTHAGARANTHTPLIKSTIHTYTLHTHTHLTHTHLDQVDKVGIHTRFDVRVYELEGALYPALASQHESHERDESLHSLSHY